MSRAKPTVDTNIRKRYKVLELLGSGAYGTVWKVVDKRTKRVYALKRIFDAFANQRDAKRTYREITVQKQLRHKNIIRLVKVMRSPNANDIYVLFEFMNIDIFGILGGENLLLPIHKKFIIYQLLCSLKYIHSAKLIHRDITPSNILLDSDCNVKLSDFGLVLKSGSKYSVKDYFQFSSYIAARRYNAPEVILGSTKYTSAVDIWSAGCVFCELLTEDGRSLFPGRNVIHQMGLIMRITGKPMKADIQTVGSLHAKKIIYSVPIYKKLSLVRNLERRLKHTRTELRKILSIRTDQQAIDLLSRMLVFNREHRITASDALKHPYLAQFHDGEEEDIGARDIKLKLEDENPGRKITTKEYRTSLLGMTNFKDTILNRGIGKIKTYSKVSSVVNSNYNHPSPTSNNPTSHFSRSHHTRKPQQRQQRRKPKNSNKKISEEVEKKEEEEEEEEEKIDFDKIDHKKLVEDITTTTTTIKRKKKKKKKKNIVKRGRGRRRMKKRVKNVKKKVKKKKDPWQLQTVDAEEASSIIYSQHSSVDELQTSHQIIEKDEEAGETNEPTSTSDPQQPTSTGMSSVGTSTDDEEMLMMKEEEEEERKRILRMKRNAKKKRVNSGKMKKKKTRKKGVVVISRRRRTFEEKRKMKVVKKKKTKEIAIDSNIVIVDTEKQKLDPPSEATSSEIHIGRSKPRKVLKRKKINRMKVRRKNQQKIVSTGGNSGLSTEQVHQQPRPNVSDLSNSSTSTTLASKRKKKSIINRRKYSRGRNSKGRKRILKK